METVERDYQPQGVKFYYIYKALAHPETNGYVAPFDLKERLMHVSEAKRTLGSRIPWICDTMDNDLKHALGDRPNSEFIIDPTGKILVAREWSRPDEVRADLSKYVGPVDKPTRVADLEMKKLPPPQRAATGVVERIQLPGAMQPAIVEPAASSADTPYYAKLRAEISGNKLYLGFFLDPLYKVHWNNEAPALQYRVEPPAGLTVSPPSGTGPEPEVKADADPREFLLEFSGRSNKPLKVTVSYYACDDAETFCKLVTQEYLVTLQRDPDGGSRRTAGRGRGGQRPSGQRPSGQRPSSPRSGSSSAALSRMQEMREQQMFQMMRRLPIYRILDRDQDGQLSPDELESAPRALRSLDRDGDGQLSSRELQPGNASGRQR